MGESEADFRVRLTQAAHEKRDDEVERLRARYRSRFDSLRAKIRTAEDRVAREEAQYQSAKTKATVSIGSSILGAIFGRKVTSSRAASGARSASYAATQHADIDRAQARVEDLQRDMRELEDDMLRNQFGCGQSNFLQVHHS